MKLGTRLSRICCAVVVSGLGLAASATDLTNSTAGHLAGSGTAIQYRLFHPTDLQPAEKAPLVVFLQGMGDRGTDNVHQTDWISGLVKATQSGEHSAYVLAPQIDTKSWFQSYGNTPTPAMKLTIQAIKNTIKSEDVDPSRVYVTGLSMGGMGTWDILGREPGMFAAAVPMSGGGDERTVSKFKDTPIWAFHGDADTIVPVSETRSMIAALKAAGGDPKYTEIKGGGHTIWDKVYDEHDDALYDWMFNQRLGGDAIDAAGHTQTPVFAVAPTADPVAAGITLDTSVPEPGTLSLAAISAIAALARRTRRRAI
jgi:predicted peptidase